MNRIALKSICNSINSARETLMLLGDDSNKDDICKLENGLIDAENAALRLWEDTAITDGDEKEALNSVEEDVFNHLQMILRFDDKMFANVTHSQKFSASRVIVKQGGPNKIQHPVSGGAFGDTMIGIAFPEIFIGIEPDGYAHS